METPVKTKKQLRYRMYFWLMDLAFVCAVMGFLYHLGVAFGGGGRVPTSSDPLPILILLAAVLLVNFVVPFFLFWAKFMRDEYADQLWRRKLTILAYASATIPFVIWSIDRIIYGRVAERPANSIFIFLDNQASLNNFMVLTWGAYMLLFVAIFQFLRWKDKLS